MFELQPHGADVFVGTGPQYPWGGLYGGQIVAQALRAATLTLKARDEPTDLEPHSIRAYFIRPGDASEPVRYEVDRIRNGRSFATRRVVARQAIGAILNAEASFQRPEVAEQVQSITMPRVPRPNELDDRSWTEAFDRADVPVERVVRGDRDGVGRSLAWMKVNQDLGDPTDAESQLLHRSWLAYLTDDSPSDAVRRAHPVASQESGEIAPESGVKRFHSASLDHTIWFHRPLRADRWHLHDFSCHHFVGGRGLTLGHVFTEDGTHVATAAQEVLLRDRHAVRPSQ